MKELISLLSKKNLTLVNSGNAAIFCALYLAKEQGKTKVLIPKEGGWFSYKHYPKMLGMEIIEVNCDWALLSLDDLKDKIDEKSVLLYSTSGGYFVDHPQKKIYDLCKKKKCLVIADVTPTIGKSESYGDFIVASTGKQKPLGISFGGFIASDLDLVSNVFSLFNFPEEFESKLKVRVKELPKIWKAYDAKKKELLPLFSEFDIKYQDSLNILVTGDLNEIIKVCVNNKIPFVKCPKYHKVKKKAISIEIKKMFD
jgi:hypothetical protein